jgi:hypothetical protein
MSDTVDDPFYGIPLVKAQAAQRAQRELIAEGFYSYACPFVGRVELGPELPDPWADPESRARLARLVDTLAQPATQTRPIAQEARERAEEYIARRDARYAAQTLTLDDSLMSDLAAVLDYNYADEERDYCENGGGETHVFPAIERLSAALQAARRA